MTPLARLCLAVCLLAAAPAAWSIEANAVVQVTPLLKATESWDGKPTVYPGGQAEVTGLIVEIAPGGETGWHEHPVPNFGLMLAGELEVTLADGRKKRLKAGDALSEVVNTRHNGRNVGTVPVRIVVFYAGAVGVPLTLRHTAP